MKQLLGKELKIIQPCTDWCLINRFETGLFNARVQICNIICLIGLYRTILGNYHAYSSLYIVGKTIIWYIVRCPSLGTCYKYQIGINRTMVSTAPALCTKSRFFALKFSVQKSTTGSMAFVRKNVHSFYSSLTLQVIDK